MLLRRTRAWGPRRGDAEAGRLLSVTFGRSLEGQAIPFVNGGLSTWTQHDTGRGTDTGWTAEAGWQAAEMALVSVCHQTPPIHPEGSFLVQL